MLAVKKTLYLSWEVPLKQINIFPRSTECEFGQEGNFRDEDSLTLVVVNSGDLGDDAGNYVDGVNVTAKVMKSNKWFYQYSGSTTDLLHLWNIPYLELLSD